MTLSPTAHAVLDAAWEEIDHVPLRHVQWAAAAVLRAASAHLGSCNASEELIRIAEELEGHRQ
jgi:hypothetical protein